METIENQFLGACEVHDPAEMTAALDAGLDPCSTFRGKLPIDWLTEMYARSDRFPACLRVLLDRGARLADPSLEPILLDDADGARARAQAEPDWLARRTTLVSSFTPLDAATLLHVAAEFGNTRVVKALLDLGADPNARAGVDSDGFGGQTPLFHVVNSNANRSLPILRLLLDAGVRVDARVEGITWGRGFEWETTLFDLTPIAYAQCGLLPQFHRREEDIRDNLRLLLSAAGRDAPPFRNVPNRYLKPRAK